MSDCPALPAHPRPLPRTRRARIGLAGLRAVIATWRWRRRYRFDLDDRARAAPHLIDDIGLTKAQLRTEIAKRFWQR